MKTLSLIVFCIWLIAHISFFIRIGLKAYNDSQVPYPKDTP